MAVKVRLMRIGAKGRPFYRVVAVDERRKRTGSYLELLGTYNPLTTPKEINLKQDRIDAWVKNGAQLSSGFLRIIGKAPRKPARKPKKERGGSSASAATTTPVVEEKASEATEEVATTVDNVSDVATETIVEEAPAEPAPEGVDVSTEEEQSEKKAE